MSPPRPASPQVRKEHSFARPVDPSRDLKCARLAIFAPTGSLSTQEPMIAAFYLAACAAVCVSSSMNEAPNICNCEGDSPVSQDTALSEYLCKARWTLRRLQITCRPRDRR